LTSLICELMALQDQAGWLSDVQLTELAERLRVPLHRLESLTTFYTHFRREPSRPLRVEVCRDLSCRMRGAAVGLETLRRSTLGRDDVEIVEVSCPGRCDHAPAARIGESVFRTTDPVAAMRALETGAVGSSPVSTRSSARSDERFAAAALYADVADHHSTLRAALTRPPAELAAVLDAAGLRGMGGAAFPTGRKWSLVAAESGCPKSVICNADESEPGTFKDREILRALPHLVIEGMALAGLTVGAERGILFIRHEYGPERECFEAALLEARAVGALGDSIFGTDRAFEIEVFVSPGGYILGEETALLECMEDRRGEPRNKPPYPGVSGLFGRPTLINNVETFAHAVSIVGRGANWWKSLGRPGFAGHKFISVSGDVMQPGVHLVPFGTSFRTLLGLCGGMREARDLVAFAPGGASSRFLPASELDLPIDFEAVARAGSMLGSGAVVYVGEGHDLLDLGLSVTRFFRNESCGKCVPCRVGTDKAVRLIEAADGLSPALHEQLTGLHETLARTSLCGLGQVALAPLLSLAERFPDRVR
jgi:NADH:ubiquinone oxidoreductase subunit F (NADH-binding)/NADH:ubiquinone oxidoreductase subunit E